MEYVDSLLIIKDDDVCWFQLTVLLEINLFYTAKILTGALCTVLLTIQREPQLLLGQFLLGHPRQ